jgi:UDP-N-acetylglucosamine--N-acetylmuramyl-(pentapeptide) pyrophosphoryl-undecaprenol N-acetylglucosamine transferase
MNQEIKKHKAINVALVGGSTAGPIVPLLALKEAIKEREPEAHFWIIDVPGSVAEHMAKSQKISFYPLRSGKLRRYFSLRNIGSPVLVAVAFIKALWFLHKHKITYVIGAGGFVQVPVIWAAWLLRKRTHIHQQDVVPTLANSLCVPAAKTMSVTFESSLRDFPQGSGLFSGDHKAKITVTGNPCRIELLHASRLEAQRHFKLDKSWPTVYILGGGSGAVGINQLVSQALPELTRTVQIIHSTGRGKQQPQRYEHYHVEEFVNRSDLAFAAADIVIARAGIATITELSNLGKVSIIIPMPDSHQEENARLLFERQAAVVLDQRELTPDLLVRVIRKLLFDLPLQLQLQENVRNIMPHESAKKISEIVFP